MGGLWCPQWGLVAFHGWRWSHSGSLTRLAERTEPFLRPGWRGTGVAERGLRRLGTWKRPSLARRPSVEPLWRPKSSNPFTRSQEEDWRRRNKTVLTYVAAAAVGMLGASYAAVPLYRLYCQTTGLGGSAVAGHKSDQVENMVPVKDRIIKVTFNADVHASLQWNFRPQQTEIYVVPGETALAFYKAKNPTDKPIIGISTYNIVPFEAGQYFNKIQQRKDTSCQFQVITEPASKSCFRFVIFEKSCVSNSQWRNILQDELKPSMLNGFPVNLPHSKLREKIHLLSQETHKPL